MGSLPVGFIMMAGVLFYSVDYKSWPLFLNMHAMIVVIIGTFSVLAIATPSKVLRSLLHHLRDMWTHTPSLFDYLSEFDQLSKTKVLSSPSKNPLINQAVSLWETGISHDLFIVMLSQKRSELENGGNDAVLALRNLAKYPPALGMTGTVVGLVSLFSNLGASNKAGLGPALALAMTATFFGLIMANAIITPLADRLHVQHVWKKRLYTETYQILLLLNRGESMELINETYESTKKAA
jgi:chemotaxis protein MotA